MPLAEGPAIDGEVLAILLAVLLALGLLWLAAVVLGFKWAIGAGGGSRSAAIKWAVAAVVVCAPGLFAGPNPVLLLALLVVGAQAACYLAARRP